MADPHTDALPALPEPQKIMPLHGRHFIAPVVAFTREQVEAIQREAFEAGKAAALASRAEGVEPVAWRDHVEHRLKTWQHRTMNESGDRVTLSDFMDQGSIDDLIDFVCDEYADTAPSHPAAGVEPIRTSSCLEGKYGNVLAPFVALMEAELHANSRKGDRPGWLSMTPEVALLEIYWHTAKLSAAVKNKDAGLVREHSADVANMAMMLLDVCGGLDVAPEPPTTSRPAAQGAGEQLRKLVDAIDALGGYCASVDGVPRTERQEGWNDCMTEICRLLDEHVPDLPAAPAAAQSEGA